MEQVNSKVRALLITGTIVPNSNFVTHSNINERRKEYLNSLQFYSTEFPEDDLYFLENSSFDFSLDEEFKILFQEKKITLLKFPLSDKFSQGKGYQEFEMLDACIDSLIGKYDLFIKITGRYKVLNLKQITQKNCIGLIADSQKKHKVTQTNVFYVRGEFYQKFLKKLYLDANDSSGIFIEHVVYTKLVSLNLWHKVNLFYKNPIIYGFSGSYGGTLNRNKYKMMLRNLERRILRFLNVKQFLIEY
ncbi:MAG: hypothetical protein SFY56_08570 [Bacteroidota bacterium]|nr:hypothetical protein [Bacteroidota bacterium]